MSGSRMGRRIISVGAAVVVVAFVLFLYFIPPFTSAKPEAFIAPERAAAPSLTHIDREDVRATAEHGKYLVTAFGCTGCHVSTGAGGPNWQQYLAGGVAITSRGDTRVVSSNLTPDPETGLARLSDAEVLRLLKSGMTPDGRIVHSHSMPWSAYSNLSEEDLRAIITYLRHLPAVKHAIPPPEPASVLSDPSAAEQFDPGDHHSEGATRK